MKEIKFKAKRVDNNEWVFGDRVQGASGKVYIFDYDDIVGHSQINEVNPETVCQFTGLKDSKGVEVFEGDVVDKYIETGSISEKIKGQVKGFVFNNRGFQIKAISYSQELQCRFGKDKIFSSLIHELEPSCLVQVIGNVND